MNSPQEPRKILFFRRFKRFGGHHLKVWHYFNHALAHPDLDPYIIFDPESVWDESNPWTSVPDRVVDKRRMIEPELLFLSGLDWRVAERLGLVRDDLPALNLIQHVFHSWPENQRSSYLSRKAIRMCLSPEVQQAIEDTGRVRGPVVTIPSAIEFDRLNALRGRERRLDVLIAAVKAPELGARIRDRLRHPGRTVELVDALIPREEFLRKMSTSRVTVFLPWQIEGFYIPALEGMAVGTLVVCPDIVVNRSFCLPGVNCLRPEYDEDPLVAAAEQGLWELPSLGPLLERAVRTAREHDLSYERQAFYDILARLDELWARDGVPRNRGGTQPRSRANGRYAP
jgi:hypothetical protein